MAQGQLCKIFIKKKTIPYKAIKQMSNICSSKKFSYISASFLLPLCSQFTDGKDLLESFVFFPASFSDHGILSEPKTKYQKSQLIISSVVLNPARDLTFSEIQYFLFCSFYTQTCTQLHTITLYGPEIDGIGIIVEIPRHENCGKEAVRMSSFQVGRNRMHLLILPCLVKTLFYIHIYVPVLAMS